MKNDILKLMQSAAYQPMNKSELARALDLLPEKRRSMRDALRKLEAQGTIIYGKKGRYSLRASTKGRLVGDLKFLKKGGAFFFADPNDESNIKAGLDLKKYKKLFVPSKYTSVALDGDRVSVQVTNQPPPRWHKKKNEDRRQKRKESDDTIGKVTQVVQRKTSTISLFNIHTRR